MTGSRFAVRRSPHPWRASQARHQYWSDLRCQVHGAAKATSLARLENVPAESRRRDRLDRPIRGSDDLISAALWITRAGPRPETHPLAWRHRTSECRISASRDNRRGLPQRGRNPVRSHGLAGSSASGTYSVSWAGDPEPPLGSGLVKRKHRGTVIPDHSCEDTREVSGDVSLKRHGEICSARICRARSRLPDNRRLGSPCGCR